MKSFVFPFAVLFFFVTTAWVYKTNPSTDGKELMLKEEAGVVGRVAYEDTILFPGETHFANVQQLTFGGDNAEAYFSFDGKWLVFQKTIQRKE
jgi:hypothetical protein